MSRTASHASELFRLQEDLKEHLAFLRINAVVGYMPRENALIVHVVDRADMESVPREYRGTRVVVDEWTRLDLF